MFDDGLVQRIREAGKLPEDPECIARTGFELGEHLNLLKGIWIQHPQPDRKAPSNSCLDAPRAITPAQKFIRHAQNLTHQLSSPILSDAHLSNRIVFPVIVALQRNCETLHGEYALDHNEQLFTLVESTTEEQQTHINKRFPATRSNGITVPPRSPAVDVVAQRLLDFHAQESLLSARSLAMVQRMAEPPALPIQFHSSRVHDAFGAVSKDEVRKALKKLINVVGKLCDSESCNDDSRNSLSLLSEQINYVSANAGKLIGRWRTPEHANRVIRDLIVVELRVMYRVLTPAKDRHSKYDKYGHPPPYRGHENEPVDLERPNPFSSIVRLALEHIERNDKQIPGNTLAEIILRASDIVDPIAESQTDYDQILLESTERLATLHQAKPK